MIHKVMLPGNGKHSVWEMLESKVDEFRWRIPAVKQISTEENRQVSRDVFDLLEVMGLNPQPILVGPTRRLYK
jgi:hypothetical protein